MPITSAPIGRNRHMSISHRRDNPFIMAVIARHTRHTRVLAISGLYRPMYYSTGW